MTPRSISFALLLAVSAYVCPCCAQERVPLDQVRSAAEGLMLDKDIQIQFLGEFDLKKQAEEPVGINPATIKKPQVERLQLPIASLAGVLAAMLLFTIAAIVLDIVRRSLPSWSPLPEGEPLASADTSAVGHEGPSPLYTADGFASSGRFSEAMHLLLLAAVQFVFARAARPLPDSLTSREILRRPELTKTDTRSLATLVGFVERTRFGMRVPTPDDYDACRSCFVALTQLTVRA